MKLKSLSNKDRYGNMFSVEFFEPQESVPMMMLIPEMEQGNGYNGADTSNHPGDPRGTDTVPAWLTPGENVVNAEASRIPGNQEMIDEMNNQGRAIQQSQGGPIPTYEADGGIIPPMYAAEGTLPLGLRQNNPGNIRPGAGFIGESGAKDGYSVFDSEEEGLRAIQRLLGTYGSEHGIDTLEGFAGRYAPPSDNNPTSSYVDYLSQKTGIAPNEKINLADRGAELIPAIVGFEQGQMPYTEDQIRMAIEMAGTDDPEAVKAILDGVPPTDTGLMSAEASTLVTPTYERPPTDENNYGVEGKNNAIVRDGVTYTVNEEGEYLDKNGRPPSGIGTAIQSGFDSVSEFFSGVKDIVDRGPINPIDQKGHTRVGTLGEGSERHDVYKDKDGDFYRIHPENPGLRVNVFDFQKVVPLEGGEVEITKSPIPVDKITGEQIVDPTTLPVPTINGVPPVAELDGVGIPEGQQPLSDDQKDALIDMMDPLGRPESAVPVPTEADIERLRQIGSAPENEGFVNTVIESFKDAFKDLFTGKELARMAILYTGQRLMGYSHEGSLGYSAKSLMQREAKFDTQNFDAVKANKDAYTAKSYNKFLKSRDMEDLDEINKNAYRIKKRGGKTYHRRLGVLSTTIGTDDIERVMVNGTAYRLDDPRIAPFLEDYQASIHDVNSIKKGFEDRSTLYIDSINQTIPESKDQVPKRLAVTISDEANTIYNTYKKRYGGMSTAQRNDLSNNINLAQAEYYEDYNRWIKSGRKEGDKPISLEAYFKAQQMNIDTGGAISVEDTRGTNMKTVAKIDRQIAELAYGKLSEDDQDRPDLASSEYKRIWKSYKTAWTKYLTLEATDDKVPSMFADAAGEGKNAFMNWVEHALKKGEAGDKAREIFQIVKDK